MKNLKLITTSVKHHGEGHATVYCIYAYNHVEFVISWENTNHDGDVDFFDLNKDVICSNNIYMELIENSIEESEDSELYIGLRDTFDAQDCQSALSETMAKECMMEEKKTKISRVAIAKLLKIDKDTLYKLDAKIKKISCVKSQEKLQNYIDLYLYRKYLS